MTRGLTEAVTRACAHAPSVFLLDEIDAFHTRGQNHNGYMIGVVTGLLTQLDRVMRTEAVAMAAFLRGQFKRKKFKPVQAFSGCGVLCGVFCKNRN
ncbi:MAG: AAA family ATPase [Alphaproteobacteria bacterium]|jgi:AAA+ superfamily predicted ATPase|nr:AAA family ATPase [Alphaproteobacteria bacterium]